MCISKALKIDYCATSRPRSQRETAPKNVIGDFYVEDGCCTLCGVPEAIAPNLFETSEGVDRQCYVKRQPTSPDQLRRMIQVFAAQDLGCIRYKGRDAAILNELVRIGERERCDSPPFAPPKSVLSWL